MGGGCVVLDDRHDGGYGVRRSLSLQRKMERDAAAEKERQEREAQRQREEEERLKQLADEEDKRRQAEELARQRYVHLPAE